MQHGTRKRQRFDPLATVREKRYLVVRDRTSQLIAYSILAPGSNLRAALEDAASARAADGWTVEKINFIAALFFCSRQKERLSVSIVAVDPAVNAAVTSSADVSGAQRSPDGARRCPSEH
jgi:hypothetical protein